MATMLVKSLLGACAYRAPHDMMLSQVFYSYGISGNLIDSCAMIELPRPAGVSAAVKELALGDRPDETFVSQDLTTIAAAWDYRDMRGRRPT